MPTFKRERNGEVLTCDAPHPPGAPAIDHRRSLPAPAADRLPLPLFNKVRNSPAPPTPRQPAIPLLSQHLLRSGHRSHHRRPEGADAGLEQLPRINQPSQNQGSCPRRHRENTARAAPVRAFWNSARWTFTWNWSICSPGSFKRGLCLLFSAGFQVNLGVISALAGKGEYILADKSDHASIVEGCLLAQVGQARLIRFAHKDMLALANRLQRLDPAAGKLIVVDGVFSMEGDIIQLPELCRLASQYGAAVMVDDAHAIGVLGRHGAGTASHFGVTDQVQLIMGTFSKSLASLGGFIASDAATIDYLKHNSRPLIFSASMSPANAAAVMAALQIMQAEPERIAQLWRNTERMKRGLASLGYDLGNSETPILPVFVRDLVLAFRVCKRVGRRACCQSGGVSRGAARRGVDTARLMATHTDAQIDFALATNWRR